MKTFAIGDIHGAHLALKQCIERSGIDKETDKLIVLGDVVDGWSHSSEVVDILLEFKHLIKVLGNHDLWFKEYMETGSTPGLWTNQGGEATIKSYKDSGKMQEHKEAYFDKTVNYYLENNSIFVHAGINEGMTLKRTPIDIFLWDRDLFKRLVYRHYIDDTGSFGDYNKIFIGHTATQIAKYFNKKTTLPPFDPIIYSNVIALDTGAGYNGRLTIMDIDTLEYWQSDFVPSLYPHEYNARH